MRCCARPSRRRPSRSPAWDSWWHRKPAPSAACSLWHHRSVPGADPGGGRQRGRDSGGDRSGASPGAPGTTAALAHAERSGEEGRRHGVLLCGRLKRRFHSGERGSGHDRRGERRGADAGEAGSHDLCLLRRSGYDRHSRRHHTGSTISGIIADEMAIGMVNQKTTAVRVIPVIGKGVGETVEFGGLLGYAPIMPVNPFHCDAFVNRGGRIPAPVHSFKN